MKSLKKISVFALLFIAFGFTSCSDVEPLDPAVIGNPTPNPTNPNPTNPGTSTGDYWPAALNNSWTFKDNGVTQPAIKIVSINSIGTETYYTFNQGLGALSGQATTRLKKVGGSYYYRLEDLTISGGAGLPGVSISGFEQIILKDNIEVGGTWSGNYVQTITYTGAQLPPLTNNVSYVGTIMEKDASVTVHGETYTNVIKVKMVQTTDAPDGDIIDTSFFWFAKDVGPIKYTIEDEDELSNAELLEYILN